MTIYVLLRDMKVFTINNDIQGRAYKELVCLLGGCAATCQLVSHGDPTTQSCKEALSKLVELGATTEEVTEWHGTKLVCGNTAILHAFPVNQETMRFLVFHVDSLFSWRWPDEPEDLCFLASDGTPLLISTAHEQYARLAFADDIGLSVGLEVALEESAKMNGPCGFVVKLPDQTVGVKNENGYVGIEGDGWPVDLPDMPTIDNGLASVNEFERSAAYWRCLMNLKGFEAARLLYLGEQPPCEGFRPIGFDCGYYANETDNLSLVLNELHLRTTACLEEHKRRLNAYGLFATHEEAMMFLRQVLSEPLLRNAYWGCLENLTVVKVHSYHRCSEGA